MYIRTLEGLHAFQRLVVTHRSQEAENSHSLIYETPTSLEYELCTGTEGKLDSILNFAILNSDNNILDFRDILYGDSEVYISSYSGEWFGFDHCVGSQWSKILESNLVKEFKNVYRLTLKEPYLNKNTLVLEPIKVGTSKDFRVTLQELNKNSNAKKILAYKIEDLTGFMVADNFMIVEENKGD